MEDLRGLRFDHDVPVRVVDAATARRHMLRRLEQFESAERLERVQRAYALLGLLPPEANLLESLLEALEQQVGGYYDPEADAFYLLDDIPRALAPAVAAHELTHALEDQHYGLDRRLRRVENDDDRLFALGALHEGSASLLMGAFVARRTLEGRAEPGALAALADAGEGSLDGLPPVLVRQLVGPYVLGAEFLARGDPFATVARGFPVEDAARAYADSPTSSEQILHPEKYWDPARRDEPRRVAPSRAGRALGRRWKRCADGVLGELSLGVLVGAETPLDGAMAGSGALWSHPATSGWDGDRWELWTRRGDSIALLTTVWDSELDAQEFAAAIGSAGKLRCRVRGDRVAVLAGPLPAHSADKVLKRMLVLE